MNIEELRKLCLDLDSVTEDIKWDNNLCFCIGGKMFCITGIEGPLRVSLKVRDDEFEEILSQPSIVPAPYLARYKWILIEESGRLNKNEWAHYLKQSYELVKEKLPKKALDSPGKKKQKNPGLAVGKKIVKK